jgi:osmotically-inducible protein OsmY
MAHGAAGGVITRSDLVNSALQACGYGELHKVRAEDQGGMLILQGRVSRYYLKQMAQTLALHVPGADQVVNRIEVTAT